MMKICAIYKYPLILILLVVSQLFSRAQVPADSIILSAMKHELNRNMKELVKDDYAKPFFISYTIADIKTAYASASLGALTGSGDNVYKDWNVRVMVGDYELNDENFVSNDNPSNVSRVTHQMPLENDYLGIRMALWSVTDNVYNSAAQNYKQKKSLIEDDKVQKDLLGISDFSKAEVVKKIIPSKEYTLNKVLLEQKARELSNVFSDYPEILNSGVRLNQFVANLYFINSEGTEVVFPLEFSAIAINLNTITKDNETVTRSLVYNTLDVSKLPENKDVISDIRKVVDDIDSLSAREKFEDEYTGPVLYVGDAVVNVLAPKLFPSNNNLIAKRKPLKPKEETGTYYDDRNTPNKWKIGKKVLDESITVTDYTSMKTFNGTELWGNYSVDAEGVVPPDSLTLIKNGVLVNKLNGRTPAQDVDSTNGHMRTSIGYSGAQKSIGPGIVKISSSGTNTHEELKQKLIEMAKEEGYDYGIMVKSMGVTATEAPLKVYKVLAETGEEIPLHAVSVGSPDDKSLKNIAGVSDSLMVKNMLYSFGYSTAINSDGISNRGMGGMPTSFIVPSAILLEDIDVSPKRIRYSNMTPLIESPLEDDK